MPTAGWPGWGNVHYGCFGTTILADAPRAHSNGERYGIHLRTLDLTRTGVTSVPSGIGGLSSLEVLELAT